MWSVGRRVTLHIEFRENTMFLKKIFPYCSSVVLLSMQLVLGSVLHQRLPYKIEGVNCLQQYETKLIVSRCVVLFMSCISIVLELFSHGQDDT